MPKVFYCEKLGSSCQWHSSAETEDELIQKVMVHAADEHDVKDMTEAQLSRIKELIQDE